jgi:hypothetical protein
LVIDDEAALMMIRLNKETIENSSRTTAQAKP